MMKFAALLALTLGLAVGQAQDITGGITGKSKVIRLQGYTVDLSTAPATGQILTWNGTSWVASLPSTVFVGSSVNGLTMGIISANTGAGGTLTPSTTYYYAVTAVNGSGESSPSLTSVTTGASGSGNYAPNLYWTAVPGATSYRVYRNLTSGSFSGNSLIGTPAASPFSDTGSAATTGSPGAFTMLQLGGTTSSFPA